MEKRKKLYSEKTSSEENQIKYSVRTLFYNFLNKISEFELPKNTTGSGIFDKTILDKLKKINDPYPYFRGLITELGEDISTIKFKQPARKIWQNKK